MNEITLHSRHRIRNWRPGGQRPSMLPLGPYNITSEQGRNIFVSLKLEGRNRARTRDLRISKQAASTTAPCPRLGRIHVRSPDVSFSLRTWQIQGVQPIIKTCIYWLPRSLLHRSTIKLITGHRTWICSVKLERKDQSIFNHHQLYESIFFRKG